jgi:small conductance mechanosensitive channel
MSSPVAPLTEAISAGEKAASVDAAMIAKLTDMAGDFAINLAIAIVILVVTVFASRWAAGVTRRVLGRMKGFRSDPTVLSFAAQVVRVVVFIVGFIAVLQRLGVQTTSIIAVLGAASLAVGLALQGTLSNVAAGVMLLILRPYRVGDLIDVGGRVGTVQRLDLFLTQLSDANNVKIVVPNSKVFGDVIMNLSGQKARRMELKIGVGYGDDLNRARDVLIGAATGHAKVLPDPAPWAGVTALRDSSVEVSLQAWTKSADYWQAKADVLQAAKEALDAAGIEIPFPHQVAIQEDGATTAQAPKRKNRARKAAPSSDPSPGDAHQDSGEG